MKKANLVNAAQMSAQNPTTFERPPASRLNSLKRGDIVQVCADGERFWVTIISINGAAIAAKVDNDLINTSAHGLIFGDIIELTTQNIYKIY